MKYNIAGLLILCLLQFACNSSKTCTYVCQDGDMHIFEKGYPLKDIDTIILKQYSNGSFTDLKAVSTVYQDTAAWIGINDSTLVHLASLKRGYNWELSIPSLQKTYKISEIKDEGAQTKEGECSNVQGCINQIVSFKVNDTMFSKATLTLTK